MSPEQLAAIRDFLAALAFSKEVPVSINIAAGITLQELDGIKQ